ncbi:caspase family protein [Sorangium sp. So ce260]|uniref:caspase family protein n=1 Tax=Sorangium sp. So ce260 TaxID=3133291 RepID=UPI003F5FE0FD
MLCVVAERPPAFDDGRRFPIASHDLTEKTMTDNAHPAPSAIPDDVKPVLAATRELLSRIRGVALLIGVESYRDHDEEGGKDLLAGRNDVLAYWKVCRRLGYTHFRVLTTPALGAEDLIRAERELSPELHPGEDEAETRRRVEEWLSRGRQGAGASIEIHDVAMSSRIEDAGAPSVLLGEATSLQLEESARWLASSLVFTVNLAWEQWRRREELMALPGFLAYSGHGAQRDGELFLCPSDTGPALENAVSFSALRAIFDEGEDLPGGKRPADNLTVVLDCCFAAARGPAGSAQRGTSLTPAGSPAAKAPARAPEIARSVFCASGRDEQSYQAMLGGHWHGAFTWAFTVALEQWKLQQQGQFMRSTMSHAELLFRTRTLLSALSFRQHPILVDELGNLPVFHHGAAAGEATSAEPDGKRPGVQLDPSSGKDFAWYQLLTHDAKVLIDIIATRTAGSGFDAGKEYWRIRKTNVPPAWGAYNGSAYCTDAFSSLTFKKQSKLWTKDGSGLPFEATDASFTMPVRVASGGWAQYDASGRDFQMASQGGYGLRVNVWQSGGAWAGEVEFLRMDPGSLPIFGGSNDHSWNLQGTTQLRATYRFKKTLNQI